MVTETDKYGSHFGIANRVIFWKAFHFPGHSFPFVSNDGVWTHNIPPSSDRLWLYSMGSRWIITFFVIIQQMSSYRKPVILCIFIKLYLSLEDELPSPDVPPCARKRPVDRTRRQRKVELKTIYITFWFGGIMRLKSTKSKGKNKYSEFYNEDYILAIWILSYSFNYALEKPLHILNPK